MRVQSNEADGPDAIVGASRPGVPRISLAHPLGWLDE
jgi:hypothetical protein